MDREFEYWSRLLSDNLRSFVSQSTLLKKQSSPDELDQFEVLKKAQDHFLDRLNQRAKTLRVLTFLDISELIPSSIRTQLSIINNCSFNSIGFHLNLCVMNFGIIITHW